MSDPELKTATTVCSDVDYGKRLLVGELGTEDVRWEIEYLPELKAVRLTGTVKE